MREDAGYVEEWRRLWEGDAEAIAYNGATCDPTKVDPKVLDWVKEHCARKPHFVKIVPRNAARGQPGLLARSSPCIAVPAPFVHEHFHDLGRVSTLENSAGKRWKVAFSRASKHPVWLQGWKKFATDNDLRPDQIAVFELTRDSHFRFTLFDEGGNVLPSSPQNLPPRNPTPRNPTPRNRTQPNRAQDDDNVTRRRVRRELSFSDVENPRTRRRVISSDNDADDDDDSAANPEQENAQKFERVSRDERVVARDVATNKSPRWRLPESAQGPGPSTSTEQVPATAPRKRRRLRKMADIRALNSTSESTGNADRPRGSLGILQKVEMVEEPTSSSAPLLVQPLASDGLSKRRPACMTEDRV